MRRPFVLELVGAGSWGAHVANYFMQHTFYVVSAHAVRCTTNVCWIVLLAFCFCVFFLPPPSILFVFWTDQSETPERVILHAWVVFMLLNALLVGLAGWLVGWLVRSDRFRDDTTGHGNGDYDLRFPDVAC